MREKDFQTTFSHWLKSVYKKTACFELKITHTDSLPFSDVKPHQVDGLYHAKHGKLFMKLPDVGFQMPFDCFMLSGVDAYVVVRYASKNWYMIDIDAFIEEKLTCSRKSLTEEKARQIAAPLPSEKIK